MTSESETQREKLLQEAMVLVKGGNTDEAARRVEEAVRITEGLKGETVIEEKREVSVVPIGTMERLEPVMGMMESMAERVGEERMELMMKLIAPLVEKLGVDKLDLIMERMERLEPMMERMMPMMERMGPETTERMMPMMESMMGLMMPLMEKIGAEEIDSMMERMGPMMERMEPMMERMGPETTERMMPMMESMMRLMMPLMEKIGAEEIDSMMERMEPMMERMGPMMERMEPMMERMDLEKMEPMMERMMPMMERMMPAMIAGITKAPQKKEITADELKSAMGGIVGDQEMMQVMMEPMMEIMQPMMEDMMKDPEMIQTMMPMMVPMMGSIMELFVLPKFDVPKYVKMMKKWLKKGDKVATFMIEGTSPMSIRFYDDPELGVEVKEGEVAEPDILLDMYLRSRDEYEEPPEISMWGMMKDMLFSIRRRGMNDFMTMGKLIIPYFEVEMGRKHKGKCTYMTMTCVE
jgi:hypothetical protein